MWRIKDIYLPPCMLVEIGTGWATAHRRGYQPDTSILVSRELDYTLPECSYPDPFRFVAASGRSYAPWHFVDCEGCRYCLPPEIPF